MEKIMAVKERYIKKEQCECETSECQTRKVEFQEMLNYIEQCNPTHSSKQKRFSAYRASAKVLGYYEERKKLPQCIEQSIKNRWSDSNSSYTGYLEA
jgi:hypothetical protein